MLDRDERSPTTGITVDLPQGQMFNGPVETVDRSLTTTVTAVASLGAASPGTCCMTTATCSVADQHKLIAPMDTTAISYSSASSAANGILAWKTFTTLPRLNSNRQVGYKHIITTC